MGHSAWPNTRYVINALANSMRRRRTDPVKDCASQQLRRLGNIHAIRRVALSNLAADPSPV